MSTPTRSSDQGDALVATITVGTDGAPSLSSEEMSKLQQEDKWLKLLIESIEEGTLPSDKQQSKKLLLERNRYAVVDNVLYFVDPKPPHRQRIVVPKSLRRDVMDEIHAG